VSGRAPAARTALQGLIFFPRGGSAQVVRHLARALPAAGWHTRVVAGSLGGPAEPGNARAFFGAGVDLVAVPYDRAVTAPVPVMASPPMHPSFEDRPGAPDPVAAGLDAAAAEHLATEWTRILGAPGVLAGVEVAHLHHLTPLHEAMGRLRPGLPVVTHVHGTELLMLDEAARGAPWPHAARWRERMRGWAAGSTRVIASSGPAAREAERVLGLDPARVVVVPNGIDLSVFAPRRAGAREREALFRRWLCDEPRGWSPARPRPGGVRYAPADLAPLLAPGATVVLFMGRFTAVKRASLLVRAHARAREELGRPLPLVVAGGSAGEWEGEHPANAAARSPWGGEVFLAGWRSHRELAEVLACADLMAVPSVAERFGQVYVEAMAAGVPVVACRAAAPPTFVDDDPSSPDRCGWLVEPDDEEDLARVLLEAARDPAERAERGRNGVRRARERFSIETVARAVAEVYATAAAG
jgi:glycosyltransferase involved in cell wall biosynthesis